MCIKIGPIETRNRVFLAPMSGVTDEPFRTVAHENGAGLVVSEMVASEELVKARPDMLRRALGAESLSPFVIQLAGREPHWMAEGARVAQDMGHDCRVITNAGWLVRHHYLRFLMPYEAELRRAGRFPGK